MNHSRPSRPHQLREAWRAGPFTAMAVEWRAPAWDGSVVVSSAANGDSEGALAARILPHESKTAAGLLPLRH